MQTINCSSFNKLPSRSTLLSQEKSSPSALQFRMDTAAQVKELLSSPQKIIITTHQRPDGDAIGSSLGLFHYLRKGNHEVSFISPTDYPEFLKWLPGTENVLIFEKSQDKAKEILSRATLIFCLDFNKLYRLDDLGKLIGELPAPKILIDHHLDPDQFAAFEFCDTRATSTAEIVYDFILQLKDEAALDSEIATCLYVGILTDTDRFRVPTTSSAVHRVVAALLDLGVEQTRVYENIYETFSENRLRLLGFCLREKLEVLPEINAGIIALEKKEMMRFNVQSGDTEGLVNYPLWIRDVMVSALITPRPDQVKLSLRSKGDFSVEQICREHFNGGGHRNASGGSSNLSVKETKEKLISILARSKKELIQQ